MCCFALVQTCRTRTHTHMHTNSLSEVCEAENVRLAKSARQRYRVTHVSSSRALHTRVFYCGCVVVVGVFLIVCLNFPHSLPCALYFIALLSATINDEKTTKEKQREDSIIIYTYITYYTSIYHMYIYRDI